MDWTKKVGRKQVGRKLGAWLDRVAASLELDISRTFSIGTKEQ